LQYYWNMNPAPPKPPSKNADRKALAAYFSELRRWAEALKRWEADLDSREAALEQAIEGMSDQQVQNYADITAEGIATDEDDYDCDCDDEAAVAGCDCAKCEDTRRAWMKLAAESKDGQYKNFASQQVKWLEDLWKLPDTRRPLK